MQFQKHPLKSPLENGYRTEYPSGASPKLLYKGFMSDLVMCCSGTLQCVLYLRPHGIGSRPKKAVTTLLGLAHWYHYEF